VTASLARNLGTAVDKALPAIEGALRWMASEAGIDPLRVRARAERTPLGPTVFYELDGGEAVRVRWTPLADQRDRSFELFKRQAYEHIKQFIAYAKRAPAPKVSARNRRLRHRWRIAVRRVRRVRA